jgi:hypothetical protein
MNVTRSPKQRIAIIALAILCFLASGFSLPVSVQAQSVQSKFIKAIVGKNDGLVTVMALYNRFKNPPAGTFYQGRLFQDPQLTFFDKSFVTLQIGANQFTNNDIIPLPKTARLLNTRGTTTIIKDITTGGIDTCRTTWLDDGKQNGVDIIQDIYCIDFTQSGQVVYKWTCVNHTGSAVTITCQYLLDMQITDPTEASANNSNDGPKILTKYEYTNKWAQYPSITYSPLPWFYIGFLHDLPNAPSLDPGLSAMGILDYGAPLNLTKPLRMTNGDWFTMANTIFGSLPTWPVSNGTQVGTDNAILLEFPGKSVPPGKTVEIGRTSYGTGEYERCVGNLFSLVFYPHHLVWTKDKPTPPGSYTPNPIHIEKFVVNTSTVNASSNTKVTLKTSSHLTLVDSLCSKPLGQAVTKPLSPPSGMYIGPNGVGYFDWYACANPAYFCKGQVIDTLKFTATCGICPPAFVDQYGNNIGADECDMPVIVDCAETDIFGPQYTDTLNADCHGASINIREWLKDDKGLASITWAPTPNSGTDVSKFSIAGPTPPIQPCYTDHQNHVIKITKPIPADSVAGGSFDFTFTDCLGNVTTHTVAVPKCQLVAHPDSLPPVYVLLKKVGTYDPNLPCDNNRIDSFQVTDVRQYDSGIDSIDSIAGTSSNFEFFVEPFKKCDAVARFSVKVKDSMLDGNICIRTFDCLKTPAPHYSDTCIHYCTIHDVTAPRVTITKDPTTAGKWHVCVLEDLAWDRLIDEIFLVNATNVHTKNPGDLLQASTTKQLQYCFDLISDDTTQLSSFCIEATDLAGNRTVKDRYCSNQTISSDTLCPNINFSIPLTLNPTSETITVDDIHTINGAPYVWDSGIDSVWFTGNKGMIVPPTIHGNGAKTLSQIKVSVRDSLQVDSVACVTINARDMKGNTCYATYCYPYTPDSLCPVITMWYNRTDSSISAVITDSTQFDRGLFRVVTGASGPNDNLTPISLSPNAPILSLTGANRMIRPNNSMSTVGLLSAQDLWGAFTTLPNKHICAVNFGIWIQNFAMKHSLQPNQNSTFYIPVYFVKNDSFAVSSKNITDFTFSFKITGDVNAIRFDSVSTVATAAAGWTVTASPAGSNPIVVTGSRKTTALSANLPVSNADSLVLLYFRAMADQSTRQAKLEVDSIQMNKGRDTLYTASCCGSTMSTALMPAPWGSLSGSTIVIAGACSPAVKTGTQAPTSVALDPNHPNPFSHLTTFDYTVVTEGPVLFAIYDELGKEVARLVDQVQKQGAYTLTYDGSKLAAGHYIARLATSGKIVSKPIGVRR